MKKTTLLFNISAIAILSVLFTACSGSSSENGDNQAALSAFLSNNENVVAFGSTHIKDVLDKSDYKSIPNFGEIIEGEITSWNSLLDIEAPVYYALEGPLDREGAPEAVYAFVKVRNADSLKVKLTKDGYDFEEKDGISILQDEDLAAGFKGQLAILLVQGGDVDRSKLITEAFDRAGGDASGGKVDEILGSEGDIVFGMNIENLYATSDTDLADLSEDKQEELKEMVAGSFVQTSFKFEEGAAIIETKNLFSEALMDRMFIKENGNEVIAKLGHGKARFGLAVNVDFKKMQSFADEFSPNAMNELTRSMGAAVQMAMMTAGPDGLSGLFTGEMGMVMFGDPDMYGATTPDVNFFLGLTSNGSALGKMAKEFLMYTMEEVDVTNNGLSGSTNVEFMSRGDIQAPSGNGLAFGESGISGFITFDGLDMDEFDLSGEENLLRVVEYVTFSYGNEGGQIYIKAKKGQENVLKQIMTVLIEELASELTGFSM